MPFSASPKSLAVYSSPSSERIYCLRIDKEHKAIDAVLRKHNLGDSVIRRIHAATLIDVATALREQDYEVVQFSCHGDKDGLYLENITGTTPLTWSVIANTLKEAVPHLSVVILNCCYSSEAESALQPVVPFLVTIDGQADDEAAIVFSEHFFDEFYRSTAVEQAFRHATNTLEAMGLGEKLKPILTRRHIDSTSVIQACFNKRQDSIYIDFSQAEKSISLLPVTRHEFLSLLTRKIQVHQWIFRIARERAVLPIGQFFGVFSWENANNVVTCHEVMQLKTDIGLEDCLGWTRLLVIYNDLRSERYRDLAKPAAQENEVILEQALHNLVDCYEQTLRSKDVSTVAQKLAPKQYAVTLSMVSVQCDIANRAISNGDLSRVVIALETAISSIHDLVEELTAAVTTVITTTPISDVTATASITENRQNSER